MYRISRICGKDSLKTKWDFLGIKGFELSHRNAKKEGGCSFLER